MARFQVDHIYFRVHITTAHIPIKFKCRFFAELKTLSTITNPKQLSQSRTNYRAINSVVRFDNDDMMQFDGYMVYDNELNRYKKKEIQLVINLVSDNRSDEVKLVGRVKIDLNEFMIDNKGQTIQVTKQLQNCSVNKPQVAKVTYQLELLRQQKIEMGSLSQLDREIIAGEIQKSSFNDAAEYNEFIRLLWGKEYNIGNTSVSKINKSLLNTSQFSNSSKSGPKVGKDKQSVLLEAKEKELQSGEKPAEDKKDTPKTQSQSITENIKKIEKQIKNAPSQQSMKKDDLKSKKIKISLQLKSQQNDQQQKQHQLKQQPKNIHQQKQKQQRKQSQPQDRNNQNQQQEDNSNFVSIVQMIEKNKQEKQQQQNIKNQNNNNISSNGQEQSWRTIKRQSPQKSPRNINTSKKLIRLLSAEEKQEKLKQRQRQKQQHGQPLQYTPEMYQEQQMYIESLQSQLEEANQIIDQYVLQLELLKQEAQRLQEQKSKSNSMMEESRSRGQLTQRANKEELSNKQKIIEEITAQKENLLNQILEYKKIIQQKQDIILTKDSTITQLQENINIMNLEFEQKMVEQDQVYDGLHMKIMQLAQIQTQLKRQNQQLEVKLHTMQKNQFDLQSMLSQISIQKAKLEEQHNRLLINIEKQKHQSEKSNIYQQLELKNKAITNLQALLEQERATISQAELKLNQLESALKDKQNLQSNNKELTKKLEDKIQKLNEQINKLEQENHSLGIKFKQAEKDKYLLTQQLSDINLNTLSVEKQLDQKTRSLQSQLQQLSFSYEEAQNKIAQLKFAVQSYQQALKNQERNNKEKTQTMNKKLEMFNKKQGMLRQALDLLEQQSVKIRSYVEEKQNKIKDYEDLLIYKDQELIEKSDRLGYLERKLRMHENQIQELKLQLKMTQAMAGSGADERDMTEMQEDLRTRILILNEANNQLMEKNRLIAQRLEDKQHTVYEMTKLTAKIDPLKRKLTILQDQATKYEQKIKELTHNLHQMKNNVNEKQTTISQEKQQLQHAYTQMEQLQTQIRILQDQKIIVIGQLQERELQLIRSAGQIQQKRDEIRNLQKELTQNQIKLNNLGKLLQRSEGIEQELSDRLNSIINHTEQSSPLKSQETIFHLEQQLCSYKKAQQSQANTIIALEEQVAQLKKENQKLIINLSMQGQKNGNKTNLSNGIENQQKAKNNDKNSLLKQACDQLEKLIDHRIHNRETQNLIQILINNSELYAASQSHITNQQPTVFNQNKNMLQEKSRILSRQVQKIKSLIYKKSQLSFKDKADIIQLLKPCENITNELIKCVQIISKEHQTELTEQM